MDTGVTVINPLIGRPPGFVPVKAVIAVEVAAAASPMAVLVFVHTKSVAVTRPVKVTSVVSVPLQITWSATAFTVGVGFTTMLNDCVIPLHEFDIGVTVNDALIGVFDTFVAVNEIGLPEPVDVNPITVLLFVQLYIVLLIPEPVKVTLAGTPLQSAELLIAFTTGVGLTVNENVVMAPIQVLEDGVTVIRAVIGTLTAFVAEKALMVPLELAARPIAVLLFVQV